MMAEQSTDSGRILLVAVDGSSTADGAFNWTLDNLYTQGDTIICVHSAEYKVSTGFADAVEISNAMKEERNRVDNLIAKYAQILKQKGIKGKSVKVEGKKPGEAVIQTAKDENANVIITGTRGLGTIRRTVMGSVSDFIVHHASCPVTIYRE